jgi:PIN domain nuclease of toxin-antitoxin system
VKFPLDTNVLLWAAGQPERLSRRTRTLLNDPNNALLFSAVSLWEIVIKQGIGRDDFTVDPHQLRRGLLQNGYAELPVTSEHALAVETLPPLHRDPFDRMLLTQSDVEGVTLVTADTALLRYPGAIQKA